jgi:hypothetical protein
MPTDPENVRQLGKTGSERRNCLGQFASIRSCLFLGGARDTLFLNVELCATLNFAISPRGCNMSVVERTSAGLQSVIPGCERRTLPKSTTRVDESGQGLLRFTSRRPCGKDLKVWRRRLCGPPRGKKQYRKVVYFPPLASRSHANAPRSERPRRSSLMSASPGLAPAKRCGAT